MGAAGRFIAGEARLGRWAAQRPATAFAYEFIRFGVKQAWACLFGGVMVALIIGTYLWYPHGAALARYDFLFLMALAIQAGMLFFKLESFDEAKVIFIYHVVGTLMEVFKTGVGSWIYPEPSIFHVAGVPLFSGFMYASIGSYIARSWRLFDLRFTHHPPLWSVYLLALRSTRISTRTITCPIFVLCCSRRRRSCSAGRGSTIAFITSIAACRSCSACSWWPSSSGLPRTSAPGPRPGSIRTRWRSGFRSESSVPGFCLLLISYALVTIVNRPQELGQLQRQNELQPASI